jgi:hypothetical protein
MSKMILCSWTLEIINVEKKEKNEWRIEENLLISQDTFRKPSQKMYRSLGLRKEVPKQYNLYV